jgi:amino acid transporter
VASLLYVLLYLCGMVCLLVLRRKEPLLERPFKPSLAPWAAGVVGLGSFAYLMGAALGDTTNSLLALGLIALSLPLHWAQRLWGPTLASGG